MSITKILNLKKNSEGPITTKTRKKLQSEFLERLDWNVKDFLQFLKIVEIENPINVQLKGEKILVTTKSNEVTLLIQGGGHEISLKKQDNEGRTIKEDYYLNNYWQKRGNLNNKDITLQSRGIQKDKTCLLHEHVPILPFYCTVGWVDNKKYQLIILIHGENSDTNKDKQKSKISEKKTKKIYEYLLKQNFNVNLKKIRKDLTKITGLSREQISVSLYENNEEDLFDEDEVIAVLI